MLSAAFVYPDVVKDTLRLFVLSIAVQLLKLWRLYYSNRS